MRLLRLIASFGLAGTGPLSRLGEGWGEGRAPSGKVTHLTPTLSFQEREHGAADRRHRLETGSSWDLVTGRVLRDTRGMSARPPRRVRPKGAEPWMP